MGHGIPFVYFTREGSELAPINLIEQALTNSVGYPNDIAWVFELNGVSGQYNGWELHLNLLLNAAGGFLLQIKK